MSQSIHPKASREIATALSPIQGGQEWGAEQQEGRPEGDKQKR